MFTIFLIVAAFTLGYAVARYFPNAVATEIADAEAVVQKLKDRV